MKFKNYLMCIIIGLFANQGLAQTSSGNFLGMRKNVATVMFASLGGAVVGLSTLSFYGKPEEHVNNIWTGLALGAVGGIVYVSVDNQRYSSKWAPPIPAPTNPTQVKPSLPQQFFYAWEF